MNAKVTIGALLALAVMGSASAVHWDCEDYYVMEVVPGTVYAAGQGLACSAYHCAPWNQWYYLESNGEPGLQRGGTSPGGWNDVCQESENPDLLLY